MSLKSTFLLVLASAAPAFGAQAGEPTLYGMPRTEVVPITDSKADRAYELVVKLPESYAQSADKTYPVIYMTDAAWHIEMLSAATEYLMPEVILVGVTWQKDHDQEEEFASRFRDFTALPSLTGETLRGEAAGHLAFFRDDVISYIEKNYRADPDERTYFGYSLGGQFGAFVLFTAPDTFDHYVLGSPAMSPRTRELIDNLEATNADEQKNMQADVFLSIGALDEPLMAAANHLDAVFKRRGQPTLRLEGLEIIEGGDHTTAFPETVIRSVKWLSDLDAE